MNNLTKDNITDLEDMFNEKIKPTNPLATLQIHEQQIDRTRVEIQHLSRQIEDLRNTIQYIFAGHVLINGKWLVVDK